MPITTGQRSGASHAASDDPAKRRQAARALAQLRTLVRAGFTGAPIDGDHGGGYRALVYLRWWTSGDVDVLIVTSQHQACTYRASGVNLRHPCDMGTAVVRWREQDTVSALVPIVLAWPAPDGARLVRVRPADPRTLAAHAEARWSE